MTKINYDISSIGWENAVQQIEIIITSRKLQRVIEIGGGANPTLSPEFIRSHNIQYTLLDISQSELDKAPPEYNKLCVDICQPDFSFDGHYDFAFSRMLAEHVSNGSLFHKNVRSLLKDGGIAFHFFPTLFAPPFLINYLLPEKLSEFILHKLQPGRERDGRLGKFPARYSWCRGPIKSQFQKFESIGYQIETYSGFFGHEPYYRKIPFIHRLHLKLCNYLKDNPIAVLTSFAQVLLVKK